MCENDIPFINLFNSYPELVASVKDVNVYNTIIYLQQNQIITFEQFHKLLLSSKNIDELKSIQQVYSSISAMVIDFEIYCLLEELDCPENTIEIIRIAIIEGIKNSEALRKVTIKIYPVVGEQFHIGSSATGARIRSAIEKMYDDNSIEIQALCGSFIPNKRGMPTAKIFLQSLARYIKRKKKLFEHELQCYLIRLGGGNLF